MKNLMRNSAFAAIATAFAATAAPAFADPPHCPPGHAKKGLCSPAGDRGHYRDRDRDRWDDRRDEQRAYNDGYEDGQRDAIRYNGRTYRDYRVIRDYDRYGLSAPRDGYYYAEVDGDVVMVQLATQLVTQLLN
ncbi:RcnB family protein [Henriciella marina]|uniref:RcnB family protein n=1 Tax=Henriciella marina TaxID=453851 RepID=UPI00036BA7B1|nr:RcnB family protein [Henriciella marina]